MTWAGHQQSEGIRAGAAAFQSQFIDAPVAVVDPSGMDAMGVHAEAQGYLWVSLAQPGPEYRGRLGLYIEESIEAELEAKGALAPGITSSTGLDGSLSDQLYRARLVNARGLALGIPSLEGITNLGRTLDAEDSGVLRWWMASTSERPVRIVIASPNMRLRVYSSPVLFESLFESAPEPVSPRAPSVAMAESAETMALSDLPPSVEALDEAIMNAFDSGTDLRSEAEPAGLDAAESSFGLDENYSPWADEAPLPELDAALGLSPSSVFVHEDGFAEPTNQTEELRIVEPRERAFLEAESMDDPAEGEENSEPETHVDAVVEQLALTEQAIASAPVERPRALVMSAEIDAEQFLRDLEDESPRAPRAVKKAAEPRPLTPLPTREITRNPFIRLAEGEESDSAVALEPEEPLPMREPVAAAAPLSEEEFEESADASAESPVPSIPALEQPVVKDLRAGFKAMSVQREVAPSAPAARESLLDARELEKPAASVEKVRFTAVASIDESDPFVQLCRKEWRSWTTNLDAARGPKPLSVVERMFVTDYTRLREAVRLGIAGPEAVEVLDAWQSSFQASYSEAFDALRVRGKRPTMVLDLPEMAQRLGRLQGARRVQLLLVDGMRFDLGLMVQDRLKARLDAALTERLLLWSALPTTTTYQLELLGKGPEGLKENGGADESPALVARGRAAMTPRRIRTGRLELMKLDVVEDSLREVGAPVCERLPEIADRTAEAVLDHISKQQPRTLVVVFGDHGFSLDPKAAGTTEEVQQGGSTPEEVLVPAFAWLTGAVH